MFVIFGTIHSDTKLHFTKIGKIYIIYLLPPKKYVCVTVASKKKTVERKYHQSKPLRLREAVIISTF